VFESTYGAKRAMSRTAALNPLERRDVPTQWVRIRGIRQRMSEDMLLIFNFVLSTKDQGNDLPDTALR